MASIRGAVETAAGWIAYGLRRDAGAGRDSHTAQIDVPRPADGEPWSVELRLAVAQAVVAGGGDALLKGTIAYNDARLEPRVAVEGRSVRVRQDFTGVWRRWMRNEWRLQVGRGLPMDLTVHAGASDGEWDLGGLSLRRLTWVQGASRARLGFSEPNPERMELTVNGGASALTLRGLANANVSFARVNAGAGAVTLGFDGRLAGDAEVVLVGGVSSVAIESGGNAVQVVVEGAVKVLGKGGWSSSGREHRSPAWDAAAGPRIRIKAALGLATLELL